MARYFYEEFRCSKVDSFEKNLAWMWSFDRWDIPERCRQCGCSCSGLTSSRNPGLVSGLKTDRIWQIPLWKRCQVRLSALRNDATAFLEEQGTHRWQMNQWIWKKMDWREDGSSMLLLPFHSFHVVVSCVAQAIFEWGRCRGATSSMKASCSNQI